MSILRLSSLSLTLAVAVFALGYVSPSFADQPDPTTREHGQHDGDDGTEKFLVEYITVDVNGVKTPFGVNTPFDCAGTTDKNLSVNFLTNCITPDVMTPLGLALYASAIAVRDKKLDVLLFFRTEQLNFPNRNPGELYVSDRLPVTIVDGDPGEGSADFHLTVTNPAVVLTKAHQPNKGTTLPPIAVGNIVYTAVTE